MVTIVLSNIRPAKFVGFAYDVWLAGSGVRIASGTAPKKADAEANVDVLVRDYLTRSDTLSSLRHERTEALPPYRHPHNPSEAYVPDLTDLDGIAEHAVERASLPGKHVEELTENVLALVAEVKRLKSDMKTLDYMADHLALRLFKANNPANTEAEWKSAPVRVHNIWKTEAYKSMGVERPAAVKTPERFLPRGY